MIKPLKVVNFAAYVIVSFSINTHAATKTSITSGNWGTASVWSPSGVPVAGDNVIIASGHSINLNNNYSITNVTVNTGGKLQFTSGRTLTMSGHLTVNGTVTMSNGNISFASGKNFVIGSSGKFTWEPGTNTAAWATLFTNGVESFDATSTLIIKKWYSFTVPIGSVVSSNFGNLELNSFNSPFIYEWNQNNWFQTRQILGELTIDQGWIVLDKSSSITATTIGKIRLKSANSYLDFHGGSHTSSFQVTTTSINIAGGMMNGIYNGNGNVTLYVTSDFNNSATFYGIYNSGAAGVGNGNFTMTVNGNFNQTAGDFRGNYNLTTYMAGTTYIRIGSLNFSGGIWMGQYGCHPGGQTCTIIIDGDLNINFSSSSNIFRGVGLSLLGSTYNTPAFAFSVGGKLTISGNASAQWISNAATGTETTTIAGTTSISGGTNNFNYGSNGIDHQTNITFSGNVTVSGGTTNLSAFGNSSFADLQQNLNVSNGTLILKGGNGLMSTTIAGNYVQSGGSLILYSNAVTHNTQSVVMQVNSNFEQSGGTINFNTNTNAASATHMINLNGSNYTISGNGQMTHAGAGTGSVFGMLNFNRNGTISFSRSGSHNIQQVKQNVKNGCTLLVNSGNIQIASHSSSAHQNLFRIENGGMVNLYLNQMYSNALQANSSVYNENNGTLILARTQGLYDATANGAIASTGNMTFYLEPNSVVEYNGSDNQVITGTGIGTATTNNQKYGMLRVNFNGTPDAEYVYPVANNVFVRTQLNLEQGEFYLNNYKLTIESGLPTAVVRTLGYIKSETMAAVNNGIVRWENMGTDIYTFPFGFNSSTYLPVIFSSASYGWMEVSTRRTTMTNNTPWTGLSHVAPVTNMYQDYVDVSVPNVIDRWWVIYAPGMTGSLKLTYDGDENTTDASLRTGLFSIQAWNGVQWLPPQGSGTGVTSGTGTVSASSFSDFLPMVLVSTPSPLPVQLISFNAKKLNYVVDTEWVTASEKNNSHFLVERSADGKKFETLGRVNGAGNSTVMNQYRFTDDKPLPGTSYYRLKQFDFDGKFSFSKIEKVEFEGSSGMNEIEVLSLEPNPFNETLNAVYNLPADGETLVRIMDAKGKTVYSENEFRNSGANQFSYLDGSKLKSGIYFLLINQGNYRTSKRIVKQ